MNRRISILLTLILAMMVWSACPLLAEEARPGIVVWKLSANEGVNEADTNLISNFVTSQVAKHSGSKVVSEADITTILKGVEIKQQCGVQDASCMAEIGAALGVPEAVSGDIGKLGDVWMLNLRRINVRSAEVVARSSRQVEGKVDDIVLVIPSAVAELFGVKLADQPGTLEIVGDPPGATILIDGKEAGYTPFKKRLPEGNYKLTVRLDGYLNEQRSVDITPGGRQKISVTLTKIPMNPYRTAAYASFFSGVGLVAFGGFATWQAKQAGDDYSSSGTSDSKDSSRSWAGAAIAGYTIGGAAIISGVVLWILDPGDREWLEQQQVSVGPGTDGRGMAVNVSGRW